MKVMVVGASGGIGAALVRVLAARDTVEQVLATHHSSPAALDHEKVAWHRLDATDPGAVEALASEVPRLHGLINCIGFLHTAEQGPEKTVKRLDPDFFMESVRVNTLPSLLLARYFESALKHRQRSVFAAVSARVGSIGENHLGGWYSYRASKAALNMALRTLSREWERKLPNCCVAALHPGTTDTGLSEPFQANVPEGKLFSPDYTAACLLAVLDSLEPAHTGRFWSWDGSELPW